MIKLWDQSESQFNVWELKVGAVNLDRFGCCLRHSIMGEIKKKAGHPNKRRTDTLETLVTIINSDARL